VFLNSTAVDDYFRRFSGHTQVNATDLRLLRYPETEELKQLGQWNDATRSRLKMAEGSVQALTDLPETLRAIYRTAWEQPMRSLIDMAADRGAFIDQSQSLNLFIESPSIGQLSSMYFYAWKKGLKTTYYLRSRPATKIAKTMASAPGAGAPGTATPIGAASSSAATAGAMPGGGTFASSSAAAGGGQSDILNSSAAHSDASPIACSLENPEHCEACQ
jgi:ribonucleoside-diphosphate reductase alpha chain